MSDNESSGCGCWGCLSVIAVGIVLWAACFGVTVAGRHYGMSGCSCDKGVEFGTGESTVNAEPHAPAPPAASSAGAP